MAKERGKEDREAIEKRHRRFWDAAQLIVGRWIRQKFDFDFDGSFEPADIEGPLLVAINHASAYDPIFVGAAFRNKPLTFIASEHILRSKPWGPILDRYISFIPHQKGARGSRTALLAIKRIRKGESIFLAVEGEQTWNGRPLPVMPYTGKLVKSSGATLVTYMLEGAYLSAPRWATNTRRGKVYGHPVGVYGPERLKDMTEEEIEQLIADNLFFDIWEWQRSQPGGPVAYKCTKGGNADGLERSVFTCPACGSFGTLRSKGDGISCSCGFRVRMSDTGSFFPDDPFRTVADWEDFDKDSLNKALDRSFSEKNHTVFSDKGVELHFIEDGHNDRRIASGKLSLSKTGEKYILTIGNRSFDFLNISNMTMVLAGRIVFSDESGYYELLAKKGPGINLRKYVIARSILLKE